MPKRLSTDSLAEFAGLSWLLAVHPGKWTGMFMPGSILCVSVCVPEGVKPWLARGVQLVWLRQSERRLKGCLLCHSKQN